MFYILFHWKWIIVQRVCLSAIDETLPVITANWFELKKNNNTYISQQQRGKQATISDYNPLRDKWKKHETVKFCQHEKVVSVCRKQKDSDWQQWKR